MADPAPREVDPTVERDANGMPRSIREHHRDTFGTWRTARGDIFRLCYWAGRLYSACCLHFRVYRWAAFSTRLALASQVAAVIVSCTGGGSMLGPVLGSAAFYLAGCYVAGEAKKRLLAHDAALSMVWGWMAELRAQVDALSEPGGSDERAEEAG